MWEVGAWNSECETVKSVCKVAIETSKGCVILAAAMFEKVEEHSGACWYCHGSVE